MRTTPTFVGQIYVKSGQVEELQQDIHPPGATAGTLTTPATNENQQPQDISHIQFCGTRGTTTTPPARDKHPDDHQHRWPGRAG